MIKCLEQSSQRCIESIIHFTNTLKSNYKKSLIWIYKRFIRVSTLQIKIQANLVDHRGTNIYIYCWICDTKCYYFHHQLFSSRCRFSPLEGATVSPNKHRLHFSVFKLNIFSPFWLQISGCIILGVSIYLKVSKDGNVVRSTPCRFIILLSYCMQSKDDFALPPFIGILHKQIMQTRYNGGNYSSSNIK